jgi:hypothetical protein
LSPKNMDEQAERDEEEIAEVEMILETYFMSVDNTFNKLQTLCEYIDDTEVFSFPSPVFSKPDNSTLCHRWVPSVMLIHSLSCCWCSKGISNRLHSVRRTGEDAGRPAIFAVNMGRIGRLTPLSDRAGLH